MTFIPNRMYPGPIGMIRADHSHVLVTFHQYDLDTRPGVKQGLVGTICTALEIHAELEEEIFYPAVRAVSDNEVLKKSVPEHVEMRRLIGRLRAMEPTEPHYDELFLELMRDVIHHVADEESVVLPEAQRLLSQDRLDELGAQMTQRRIDLTVPRTGEIAVSLARSAPASTVVLGIGALVAGAWILSRFGENHRHALSAGGRTWSTPG